MSQRGSGSFGVRRVVAAGVVAAVGAVVALTGLLSTASAAQESGHSYGDVDAGAFFAESVRSLAGDGVFSGTECATGFCPGAVVDRKTTAVWLVRILDREDPAAVAASRFDDVGRLGFHAPFIERMVELGVTGGCGDGSGFCPDRAVTRAQMAVFLSRAFDLPDSPDPGFADVPASAWYAPEVANLAAAGVTAGCGDGSRFCPDRDVTRGQMATFLARADGRVKAPGRPVNRPEHDDLVLGPTPQSTARTGKMSVPVFICDAEGAYTSSDLQQFVSKANEIVAPWYQWQSSGRFEVAFTAASVLEPPINITSRGSWAYFSPSAIDSGCVAPAAAQAGTRQFITLAGANYVSWGTLWTGPAHVWVPDGGPSWMSDPDMLSEVLWKVSHEFDHSLGVPHMTTAWRTRAGADANSPVFPYAVTGDYFTPVSSDRLPIRTPLYLEGRPPSDGAGISLDGAGIPERLLVNTASFEGFFFPCRSRELFGWPVGGDSPACVRQAPYAPLKPLRHDSTGTVIDVHPPFTDGATLSGYLMVTHELRVASAATVADAKSVIDRTLKAELGLGAGGPMINDVRIRPETWGDIDPYPWVDGYSYGGSNPTYEGSDSELQAYSDGEVAFDLDRYRLLDTDAFPYTLTDLTPGRLYSILVRPYSKYGLGTSLRPAEMRSIFMAPLRPGSVVVEADHRTPLGSVDNETSRLRYHLTWPAAPDAVGYRLSGFGPFKSTPQGGGYRPTTDNRYTLNGQLDGLEFEASYEIVIEASLDGATYYEYATVPLTTPALEDLLADLPPAPSNVRVADIGRTWAEVRWDEFDDDFYPTMGLSGPYPPPPSYEDHRYRQGGRVSNLLPGSTYTLEVSQCEVTIAPPGVVPDTPEWEEWHSTIVDVCGPASSVTFTTLE